MQTLSTNFSNSQGVRFTVLERFKDVALLFKPDHNFHEVVIVQTKPAETVFGIAYPAREVLPKTSQWGQYGWSFKLLVNAKREFDAQVRKRYGLPRAPHSSSAK